MAIEAMTAERWWMTAAGLCMIVAALALWWQWKLEVAFVTATLGAVCWFLSLRNRLKKSIVYENEVEGQEDSVEEDENE